MKKTSIIMVIAIFMLVGMLTFALFKNGNEVSGEVFEGTITNVNLSPQTLDGTGVYDKSCLPVENGLTQCDGGIQTSLGLLNFNYKHNMHLQKCIDKGQKLKVEIFEGGRARVTR